MTIDAGRRIATGHGAILADSSIVGTPFEAAAAVLFDPVFWATRGESIAAHAGRGTAWFVGDGERRWVLRHYRRGGLIARISEDRYAWAGEGRVRSFVEFRLLARLHGLGLPVPRPIAALYRRAGSFYRCDLITQRIEDSMPLSARLQIAALDSFAWQAVGAAVGRLHEAGADHADLNAHNILIGSRGVSLIDFDRGRLRVPGSWTRRNIARLRRSLVRVSAALPSDRFGAADWELFLAGYRQRRPR